jgi:hypothetical protein
VSAAARTGPRVPLGDGPGLLRDGTRCDAFALQPGVEIGVGNAEKPRS